MHKLASSAAHVSGRNLSSCESFTWLGEHFNVSLAQAKQAVDYIFLTGANHIFFHGTAYSPPDVAWPGWLFYASVNFGPQAGLWRDLPAFTAYVTRCQSVLQSGRADNDVLLYFPAHDIWQNASSDLLMQWGMHAQEKWLWPTKFDASGQLLNDRGYSFDGVTDRLLEGARAKDGKIELGGGAYAAIVLPDCRLMPPQTLQKLRELAQGGARIVAVDELPRDVPGQADLDSRRGEFRRTLDQLREMAGKQVFVGADLPEMLKQLGVRREAMTEQGLWFVRRARADGGRDYFIANRGTRGVDGWVPLGTPTPSALLLDPLFPDRAGIADTRRGADGATEVRLQLKPGQSCVLRTIAAPEPSAPRWTYATPAGEPIGLGGTWRVQFIDGAPELPAGFETRELASWTTLGDENAKRFAGTAQYELEFDAPDGAAADDLLLDLGKVCDSARVTLNGSPVATLFCEPYELHVGRHIKPGRNTLAVEVTNLAANRIADLDRRGVKWKNFHEVNFVNKDYKRFDASNWPPRDSGLLGPVRLIALKRNVPSNRVVISAAGAVSDGTTLNTKSIQTAIDQLVEKGGGTLVVPAGKFLTGAIFLKPSVNLHLEKDAVLLGSTNIDDYPAMPTRIEGATNHWRPALLNAHDCDGLRITGEGAIQGGGKPFWDAFWNRRKADPKTKNLDVHRPRNIFIRDSDNVHVSGISLRESGFWNLHLYRCQNATIEKVDIRTPPGAPSTDGIDIDSCQDVTVRGCYISVDDDNIALKGTKGPLADQDKDSPPVERIHITDCTFAHGHGVVTCGSEGTHVKGVLVENCKVGEASDAENAAQRTVLVRLKLRPDTPQHYEDIHFRNITLNTRGDLFSIEGWTQYFDLKGHPAPSQLAENITVENVTGAAGGFGRIRGPDKSTVRNITMKNLDVTLKNPNVTIEKVDGLKVEIVKVNGKPLPASGTSG
jgi:polygalacturonase